MKFLSFNYNGVANPGILLESTGEILDLSTFTDSVSNLTDLITLGEVGLDKLRDLLESPPENSRLAASDVEILAPLSDPKRNIICVGKNYHDHAEEFHQSGFDASAGKSAIPDCPIFFSKSYTSIIGPGAAIPASADPTNSVDYEVELGVVVGRRGRGIKKSEAYDHVYGYTIINDVTSRTLQQKHKQWFLGKNFDGFCPMGPWLVTSDEVGDVEQLTVSTHVNGELRQSAKVADLIFDIPTLIHDLSAVMTLHPGDIIATGTPSGVGLGFDPPKFLHPGDVVTLKIDRLGTLQNPVV